MVDADAVVAAAAAVAAGDDDDDAMDAVTAAAVVVVVEENHQPELFAPAKDSPRNGRRRIDCRSHYLVVAAARGAMQIE